MSAWTEPGSSDSHKYLLLPQREQHNLNPHGGAEVDLSLTQPFNLPFAASLVGNGGFKEMEREPRHRRDRPELLRGRL